MQARIKKEPAEKAATRARRERGGKDDGTANEAIYNAIRTNLLSGRFPPGLKLEEPSIARALSTSRERVRAALRRLAHEGWLVLKPNRGAFVPEMSMDEIDEVSEARVIVESAAVEILATRHYETELAELHQHLEKEAEAARGNDRAEQIRLSSDFHSLIMDLAGNRRITAFHRELTSISQLIYALYVPTDLPKCGGPHEHPQIVAAIAAGKGSKAAQLIAHHLRETPRHIRRQHLAVKFTSFADAFSQEPVAEGEAV
jgi:DNA-binding GntR family transcriptional regulator